MNIVPKFHCKSCIQINTALCSTLLVPPLICTSCNKSAVQNALSSTLVRKMLIISCPAVDEFCAWVSTLLHYLVTNHVNISYQPEPLVFTQGWNCLSVFAVYHCSLMVHGRLEILNHWLGWLDHCTCLALQVCTFQLNIETRPHPTKNCSLFEIQEKLTVTMLQRS